MKKAISVVPAGRAPFVDPRALLLDHGLAAGGTYRWRNERFKLETVHASGVVDLRSCRTNGLLQLRNPDGSMTAPTVEWMRKAYAEHELGAIGPQPEDATQRQARALLIGAQASSKREHRARWRFRLAWRYQAHEAPRTDAEAGRWLSANYGADPLDLEYPRPSPSSLRRFLRTLERKGRTVGALVSMAGRPKNHSQLPAPVDAAVSEAALYFYSGANLKQVDAHSYLDEQLIGINAALPAGRTPFALPSKEALRQRIRKFECFDTWASKYGREAALKKFQGHGEPLLVDHVLELGLMDATELEQVIVFDEAWSIPALKCRITILMDALSHAIYGWSVYPGPNRAETSAEAFMHCMDADKWPAAAVAEHPGLLLLHGRFAQLLPDNEKALIGPGTVAGYNEAGTAIIPAPVGMPTAKAALERFMRILKEALAQLPGTMIDPVRAMQLGYDATKAAVLTLTELRARVTDVIVEHNVSRTTGPFGRSPIEIVESRIATRATPAFEDPEIVRNALCRTFRVFVTRNGVEKDTIRYRDAATIDALMDNNRGRSARTAASEGFHARARRNDGNIDTLEVLDEHTGAWVRLPSTQPAYTDRLSFWEHEQYKKAAKLLRLPFDTERQRLAAKSATRRRFEEAMPKAKFQTRAKMAALLMSTKLQELAGRPFNVSADVAAAAQDMLERKDDPSLRGGAKGADANETPSGPAPSIDDASAAARRFEEAERSIPDGDDQLDDTVWDDDDAEDDA